VMRRGCVGLRSSEVRYAESSNIFHFGHDGNHPAHVAQCNLSDFGALTLGDTKNIKQE
jgi:hypothetical protein